VDAVPREVLCGIVEVVTRGDTGDPRLVAIEERRDLQVDVGEAVEEDGEALGVGGGSTRMRSAAVSALKR
jgi:hypothetical protein